MALSRIKTWISGEVLTASDLNAEFNNYITNVSSLVTPITFNLTFTDATYDIGASGATRPRDLYLSRNAVIGGTLGVTGVFTATGGISLNSATVGAWTTPTFDAANFTGNASMTWTVAAGDVTTYEYTIINKMMTVNFIIVTSTVAGTPSNTLQIAIPASKTATHAVSNPCFVIDNGGTSETGLVSVAASGTVLAINRAATANFSSATDTTQVRGSLTFQIN